MHKVAHADPHLLPAWILHVLKMAVLCRHVWNMRKRQCGAEKNRRCSEGQEKQWSLPPRPQCMLSLVFFWVISAKVFYRRIEREQWGSFHDVHEQWTWHVLGKYFRFIYLTTLPDWSWKNGVNIDLPACVCANKEVPRHKRLWKLKQKFFFPLKIFPSLPWD